MRLSRVVCSYYKKYIQRCQTDPKYLGRNRTMQDLRIRPLYGVQPIGHPKAWKYMDRTDAITTYVVYVNVNKQHESERFFTQQMKMFPIHSARPVKHQAVFVGDRVQVLEGRDKGKYGIVETVVPENGQIYVAGVHLEYERTSDEIVSMSKPLYLGSGVSLVDPSDEKPTTIEWRYDENGEMMRVSKRTGRAIPFPKGYSDVHEDGTNMSTYEATSKDTKEQEVTKRTFQPNNLSFEEDLLQKLNIKEDRKKTYKTYWY